MHRRRIAMATLAAILAIVGSLPLPGATDARRPSPTPTPPTSDPVAISVYGAWHCSDDFCTWGHQRTVAEFDSMNHWLIDRGDGRPSVNLVVLSFVNPFRLLKATDDSTTVAGRPIGMTREIVEYFTSKGIRVMVSIGGITYTDDAPRGTVRRSRWDAIASRGTSRLHPNRYFGRSRTPCW